jgi:F420-non-reducing hydrogenase iron-sulfur subunit
MCTGRIDAQYVLRAFEKGADGVLILACHPGDCHYKEQNFRALQRQRLLLQMLGQFGIAPERCRFDFVSAAEGEKYVRVVNEFVAAVREMGPRP